MTADTPNFSPEPPSPAALGRATATALALAVVILVTAVLPAEYAIDPLGTGRWLGLTAMASPPIVPVSTRATGAPLEPQVAGRIATYPGPYKYDVYEVELEPFDSIEYKYQLEANASMLFSWTATAAVVQDFHGEKAGSNAGEAVVESYDHEDRQGADGMFTAPFAGIHGWYWENPNADPVTVRLTTSGFYSGAIEIRSDLTHVARTLRGPDTWTPVAAPVAGQQ